MSVDVHTVGRLNVPALSPSESEETTPSCGGTGFFGARFSLYPMTDRFLPVILHAIEGLRERGLVVETDDVSTFLGGHPEHVFGALHRAFVRAAGSGEHVVMPLLLSYG